MDNVVEFKKKEDKPDDTVWQCNCGCQHFFLYPYGPRCADCELLAQTWMDGEK